MLKKPFNKQILLEGSAPISSTAHSKRRPSVKENCAEFMIEVLNSKQLPDYLRSIKMILLSKTRSKEASLDDARPIVIANNLLKSLKKTIKIKLE
jgi:hypothetical protein